MGSLVTKKYLEFFKGKRVLVTGDTGFKGSWLSFWLHELGSDVVGYSLPPEDENAHFNLIELDTLIHHINGDIRDIDSLKQIFDEFQPEFIFHLAAQSLVRRSYHNPKLTFDTNIGGSVNILELSRKTPPLRVLIYVTSDKCYQNREWIWGYRENDALGGHDPYAASKAAAEIVFSAYMHSYFNGKPEFGAASTRAGNVIGGGDWAPDRIVPDCIRSLQNNMPISIRNPDAIRPWQHVLEPLSGYLLLAARLYSDPQKYSGSWNFGPKGESSRNVRELTEKIVSCWGEGGIHINTSDDSSLRESRMLYLNCDKAFQVLQWHSQWDFERAVTEAVRWYKEVHSGCAAIGITRQQIFDYMGALYD